MALTGPPLVVTAGAHTSAKLRQFWDSFFPLQGVAAPGDCQVTQLGTPGQGVLVAQGGLVLKGTSSSVQGKYGDYNDAAFTVNASAADGAQTRIDRCIYRVRDPDFVGGSPPSNFEWLTGVAGSGLPPTVPADSMSLAQIARPINGNTITNGQITDERTLATALGGAVRGWTQAGAPTTGTYVTGQFGFDVNGTVWYCSAGGTPGTWYPSADLTRVTAPVNLSGAAPSLTIPQGFREYEVSWLGTAAASTNLGVQFNNDATGGNYFSNGVTVAGGSAPSTFDYEGTAIPFMGRSGTSGSFHIVRFRGPQTGLSWTWFLAESTWFDSGTNSVNQSRSGGFYKGSPITSVQLVGVTFTAGVADIRGFA